MAKTNGQDSQSVNGEFNLIRWKVCFDKCNQRSSDRTETEETFTSLEQAIQFANGLGHLDLREKYFGDKLIYPANIRIVEVGRYKKDIPWELWCELAPSIDETIKELGGQSKFKEEVDRLKSELYKSHAEIKRLKQIISSSAIMLESQLNALKRAGLTED